jgi:hypothetical protein
MSLRRSWVWAASAALTVFLVATAIDSLHQLNRIGIERHASRDNSITWKAQHDE